MNKETRFTVQLLILMVSASLFTTTAQAQITLTVDNTTDNGNLTACTAAANDCSLRGAIARANGVGSNDTIEFDLLLFSAPRTITLSGTPLQIGKFLQVNNAGSLTINGRRVVTVSGGNLSNVFLTNSAFGVTLTGLTISHGKAVSIGGGIENYGKLTLTDSTISQNTAGFGGGGIYNNGTLTVLNSTVSNNSVSPGAGHNGGGIENGGGVATFMNSTVSGNSADDPASWAGGISNRGATFNLINSTVVNNTSGSGGGIDTHIATFNVRNSIIANNYAPREPDCYCTDIISQGYNLIENTEGTVLHGDLTSNIHGVDPGLGELRDNGGGTFTHALLPNSPAIDAGSNSRAVDLNNQPLTTDQRGAGFLRVVNGTVDIGAFEALAQRRPLIFIPGILGSSLFRASDGSERWPGVGTFHDGLTLDLDDPARVEDIEPRDVIRTLPIPVLGTFQVYGPLIDRLINAGYLIDDNLFLFAYDWRKSNAANAVALRSFIEDVRSRHSGSDVDIVAHSMGGMLAQRYILSQPGNSHHVAKLITIATPWLGAPKLINTMETGDLLEWPESRLVTKTTLKKLVEFFPGAHELMPSPRYFEIGGVPFKESGWDINGDGISHQSYAFAQLFQLLNERHPRSSPATAGFSFHNIAGQDGWRDGVDGTGVQYYHFYGLKSGADTIGTVVATRKTRCRLGIGSPPMIICGATDFFDVEPIAGDGTVPLLSAQRSGNGIDLNAAGATPDLFAYNANPNDEVDHMGLVINKKVQTAIIDALNSPFAASTGKRVVPLSDESALTDPPPPVQPHYYVKFLGVESLMLTDSKGNTLMPLTSEPDAGIPGVTVYVTGEKSVLAILPRTDTYNLVFAVGNTPATLEARTGTDNETSQAVRYVDLDLPPGVKAKLQITPQGLGVLHYDRNGDGTFETSVTPTVSVTGSAAQDTESPTVSINSTAQGNNFLITVASSDAGSGVKKTYYSLNGTNFQPYTAAFSVNRYQAPVIYAFADDEVGNRSGLVTFRLVGAGVPVLMAHSDSTRAIALDSVLGLTEPFHLNYDHLWGSDRRTRIMLFALNFDLSPGETASAVTASAEDASSRVYPLNVEFVGKVPGSEWLTCVVIQLNDELGDVGDVMVSITVRGVRSNRVRLSIGHVGGDGMTLNPFAQQYQRQSEFIALRSSGGANSKRQSQ